MIQTMNYNPDVLTCLANLSNDEVFTPPNLVNDMLDLLPKELWTNPEAKFLDPVSKSGVFLREMAKRLMVGLSEKIPDKQERINHIFGKQLYGIAITELTSLLSRRSVYGSKIANGKYSFCETFDDEQGNLRYNRIKHTWRGAKCIYCGASQEVYDRDDTLETYAYNFIHVENPFKLFKEKNMKFDVIIGNPPYQLSDGGAQMSASPIYHSFIEQAKKLNPKYLTMIIPARWYSGGKGLDSFRSNMLEDKRMKELHDFNETSDVFPGLNIRGGVCYFLWDRDYNGNCLVVNHNKGELIKLTRPLLDAKTNVFVRYNKAMSILTKVHEFHEGSFSGHVSARKPFGLATNIRGEKNIFDKSVKIYQNGGIGYYPIEKITSNKQWIKEWKVIIPYSSPGDDTFPHLILSKPIIAEPNSVCTETYLVIGPFANKTICKNVASYLRTQFVRFLILLLKPTQHVTAKTYQFVPLQDFSEPWTDEKLYKKYGLTEDEIAFIESMIRPME